MPALDRKLTDEWLPPPMPPLHHGWPPPLFKSHEGFVWWYVDPWCPRGTVWQVAAQLGEGWRRSTGPIVCMLGEVDGYGALAAGNLARAYRPEGVPL